jgi:hypothetical protein
MTASIISLTPIVPASSLKIDLVSHVFEDYPQWVMFVGSTEEQAIFAFPNANNTRRDRWKTLL